jgi:RNA polymerase sigma-70 factor (ECF subfamily)
MTAPTHAHTPGTQAHSTARETDEGLVARLASKDEDALRALHRRYAALVFTVAARFVDAATAEDVVQEVFVTLWKKHATFDPARGSFKSWIIQVARRRALNEVRRKPRSGPQGDQALADVVDDSLEPDEAQWLAHRQTTIRAAVDALPSAQRQALSLAFFDELTHEQIASVLHTPVGTTKTRIRLALKRLAPILVTVLAAGAILFIVRRRHEGDERAARNERALRMITASDVVSIRLRPTSAVSAEAHGSYRARPGAHIAILTTSQLPALAASGAYVAWAHRANAWRLLGPVVVEGDGRSLLVSENNSGEAGGPMPDEVRVTRESGASGDVPRGETVLTSSTSGAAPQ